ncbi:putative ABC transporter ATP-binding protein [Fusobacterium sp. DD29]|uniref:ABC transporter ATP-binding protein n=2 Tax=Fusobacterium TaxID=848 RepID=UPI001B8C5C22|nr:MULTISPECIES: ABC transporter ATP-binding protein [unclassified Fusobacterium]MBR8700805.1 putative ABC transporter ATP-binding protein [Fusobacterium sp. DD45]MBR8749016.1 putative ABC transporter ATP-binding protein [Fusobacterium sp. DD29]MBR8751146.1 putative ABC transporter ATP-binding protein [Fusobacterium sp. DD26]MBR8761223.1 putative ABC transporter ATP-binding protein [Fusobacterium sp. DD25]MBR8767295.1 putative ABC transporter ATP-binding protein [Fusobacterium sp. DD43]
MKNRTVFKKLIPYLYRYRYKFLFMVFLAIIGNVLTLIGPYLVGKAINQIHIDMDRENFIFLGKISLCLLFTYIGGAFLSLTQNIKMNNISQEIVNAMRQNAFKKMHKFPLKMFNTMAQGNIMTIVINDIDNISSSLSQIGTRIIVNLLTISIALAIMIYISPSLTLIQMILVAISGFFLKKITKKSKEKRRVQQKFLGRLNSYVDEILTGQAEVKSFSYEERAINKFRELNGAYKENAIKAIFFSGFNFPTLNFINNIGYSLIIFTGAVFMLQGKINLGELSSFIIYSKLFNRPIASISEAYNIIQTVLVSSERFFGFMDLPEDDEGGDRELDLSKVQGNIEFKDVNFGYNDNSPVLKDLSFKTKEGKTVAIVGPTGGGKTTIVNLLMRFYDISSGKILLDGVDVKEYKKSDIRKLFGMVLQDSWLFTGTIRDNIRYGNENLTDEDIIKSAKIACAHDFISKYPQGYDTMISEDNMILSQGQKQLITIARIIASNPKFLILDEATSGVDTRTELRLQKAVSKLIKDRTSFVIAHRLSTIKNADLILVLKDGKIIEQGTHKKLMELKGFYYTMYNTQYAI